MDAEIEEMIRKNSAELTVKGNRYLVLQDFEEKDDIPNECYSEYASKHGFEKVFKNMDFDFDWDEVELMKPVPMEEEFPVNRL